MHRMTQAACWLIPSHMLYLCSRWICQNSCCPGNRNLKALIHPRCKLWGARPAKEATDNIWLSTIARLLQLWLPGRLKWSMDINSRLTNAGVVGTGIWVLSKQNYNVCSVQTAACFSKTSIPQGQKPKAQQIIYASSGKYNCIPINVRTPMAGIWQSVIPVRPGNNAYTCIAIAIPDFPRFCYISLKAPIAFPSPISFASASWPR